MICRVKEAAPRFEANQTTQTTKSNKKHRPKKWRNLYLAFKFIVSIILTFQCIFAAFAHNVGDCVTAFVLHVILFSAAPQRPVHVKMLIVAYFLLRSTRTNKRKEKQHIVFVWNGPQKSLIRNLWRCFNHPKRVYIRNWRRNTAKQSGKQQKSKCDIYANNLGWLCRFQSGTQ